MQKWDNQTCRPSGTDSAILAVVISGERAAAGCECERHRPGLQRVPARRTSGDEGGRSESGPLSRPYSSSPFRQNREENCHIRGWWHLGSSGLLSIDSRDRLTPLKRAKRPQDAHLMLQRQILRHPIYLPSFPPGPPAIPLAHIQTVHRSSIHVHRGLVDFPSRFRSSRP